MWTIRLRRRQVERRRERTGTRCKSLRQRLANRKVLTTRSVTPETEDQDREGHCERGPRRVSPESGKMAA